MKITFVCIILFSSFTGIAQLHSGTPVIHSKPQPVPNSSTAEKSAPPQPINIPPAANPVPPIYPGAETKATVIPRPLINPPTTPSGTQPVQKEPLSPVESTNTLQPNRPPRDRASKENNTIIVSPVISNRSLANSTDIYYKRTITPKTTASLNNKNITKKNKTADTKIILTKKKPRL